MKQFPVSRESEQSREGSSLAQDTEDPPGTNLINLQERNLLLLSNLPTEMLPFSVDTDMKSFIKTVRVENHSPEFNVDKELIQKSQPASYRSENSNTKTSVDISLTQKPLCHPVSPGV